MCFWHCWEMRKTSPSSRAWWVWPKWTVVNRAPPLLRVLTHLPKQSRSLNLVPAPKVRVLLLCLPQVPLCCGVPQLLSEMTVGWRYPSEAAQGAAVSRSLSPSPSLSHPSLQGDCSSLLSSSVFSSWVRLFPPRPKTHQFEFVAISLLTMLRGTHHFVCGLCFSSGRA